MKFYNSITGRYWTPYEHYRYIEALEHYGWTKDSSRLISLYVGTKTAKQVRTHHQKFKPCLQRMRVERLKCQEQLELFPEECSTWLNTVLNLDE